MKQLVFLLKPTSLETVFYLFGVVVALVITSFSSVLDALIAESEAGEIDSIGEIFGSNVDNFAGTFGNSGLSATLTTLVFWSAAGAVVYIIVWALFNGFVEFYNQTTAADTIVRGQGTDKKSEFRQNLGRLIFRVTSVVLLIAHIILSLRLLIPLILEFFQGGVTRLDTPNGWLQLFIAVAGGVLTVHMYTIIARFITMRLRAYGDFNFHQK